MTSSATNPSTTQSTTHADGLSAAGLLCVLGAGVLFGFGLTWSTMISPEVVLSFLRWRDFGLLLVLGGAVLVTFIAYRFMPRLLSKPPFGPKFGTHPSAMDRDTLLGAAIFGAGWGLCGVCPGPAIAGLGVGNSKLLIAVAAIFVGAYAHAWWMEHRR